MPGHQVAGWKATAARGTQKGPWPMDTPLSERATGAPATAPVLRIMAIAAFFLSLAWDPYMALMADLFPPVQRGRVGGLLGVGNGLGTILFLVLALNLWEHNEFLVFAICTGLLVLTWTYTFFT